MTNSKIALAVATAVAAAGASLAPQTASAATPTPGTYVAGDFHNHTTCADGSASVQKQIKKSTDKGNSAANTPWGLDWYVYSNHGNSGGTRNCTLTEDASLDAYTPATPFVSGTSQQTTWTNSITNAKVYGDQPTGTGPGYMWRWQAYQQYEYPTVEYLANLHNLPLFVGIEMNAPGHEHIDTTVINGQMPSTVYGPTAGPSLNTGTPLPITGPRTPNTYGNANDLAKWTYCFDVALTDLSRGNAAGLNNPATGPNNNWDCSVAGSNSSADPLWNAGGAKLVNPTGTGSGNTGHHISLEAIKWMAVNATNGSYFLPTHLERFGPFNPNGNYGYNIEHLRDFNNQAPGVAFGFDSQPGHQASAGRGDYNQLRNSATGASAFPDSALLPTTPGTPGVTQGTKIDSAGGTTFGGTGVYAGYMGGVWDALLGEGRNWWFFASSDYHSRGSFSNDDVRSNADFFPGEYTRTYSLVRNGTDAIRPQAVVDALRSGNSFSVQGQLIDRLSFVACSSYPGFGAKTNAAVEQIARTAAFKGTDITGTAGCATMGQKLSVRPGADIVVAVVVRDPAGTNYSPYSFNNPSLAQIGISQPLNAPVLDHVDLIGGNVTGYVDPSSPNYKGQWPVNTNWMSLSGNVVPQGLGIVPAGAKNTSTQILKTFSGSAGWTSVTSTVDGTQFLSMSFRIPAATQSQYVRLRGTNLPAGVPYETDANGSPLADSFTNTVPNTNNLSIPCTVVGTNVPTGTTTYDYNQPKIDGCPAHLPTLSADTTLNGVLVKAGTRMVAYDVAAWSDLWFYSNPIYVEVAGSSPVAGVK
jgi:hypothetical protein